MAGSTSLGVCIQLLSLKSKRLQTTPQHLIQHKFPSFLNLIWWDAQQVTSHINFLEFMAIHFTLQSFLPFLKGKTASILTDNSTSPGYVNRQGGTASWRLCCLEINLWDCSFSHIFLVANSLLGIQNTQADLISRGHLPLHKWELNWTYLCPLLHWRGQSLVGVYATCLNKKCQQFYYRGGGDSLSLRDGHLYPRSQVNSYYTCFLLYPYSRG